MTAILALLVALSVGIAWPNLPRVELRTCGGRAAFLFANLHTAWCKQLTELLPALRPVVSVRPMRFVPTFDRQQSTAYA